jgi:hypothetical protein
MTINTISSFLTNESVLGGISTVLLIQASDADVIRVLLLHGDGFTAQTGNIDICIRAGTPPRPMPNAH